MRELPLKIGQQDDLTVLIATIHTSIIGRVLPIGNPVPLVVPELTLLTKVRNFQEHLF